MRFEIVLTPLLVFSATAVPVPTNNNNIQIATRQEQDICNGTDFATVFEVRVCEPYDASTCSAIAATIQDCSYDRLLYWGCEDDASGAYNGTGGYYARVEMIPDTTNMSCVDEYLQEMFPDKTDVQLDVTDCTGRKAPQMQERNAIQVGGPYDVNRCVDTESTLVKSCLTTPVNVRMENWKCYDDGSSMYNDGIVGTYNISLAVHPYDPHPYYSNCIDAVLDDKFHEFLDVTGGLKCNETV
ncbi:hypothetical protein M409DRAFT_55905 [Zasmidium cellare ATCC 36951]|uniref:Uncharacterized protein n=1 Tax=Zasmidium cellare ATCC 36951 TaxID=1080233 RepID=A0A6A6CEN9_ZASCE|nr:uncharacterized protein M409DRAFT_55905 [Zasmidium cellare ATCC 36951]KAF2165531.1 hypothetical protein M409DRAFT_55905 [Zasmidium cellare ATCC 36951]